MSGVLDRRDGEPSARTRARGGPEGLETTPYLVEHRLARPHLRQLRAADRSGVVRVEAGRREVGLVDHFNRRDFKPVRGWLSDPGHDLLDRPRGVVDQERVDASLPGEPERLAGTPAVRAPVDPRHSHGVGPQLGDFFCSMRGMLRPSTVAPQLGLMFTPTLAEAAAGTAAATTNTIAASSLRI